MRDKLGRIVRDTLIDAEQFIKLQDDFANTGCKLEQYRGFKPINEVDFNKYINEQSSAIKMR
jgi:hypothetical protein